MNINKLPEGDVLALLTRVDELARRACDGAFASTQFLTPREGFFVAQKFSHRRDVVLLPFGGYPDAERVSAVFVPEWAVFGADSAETFADLEPVREYLSEIMCAVEILGSGYRELGHRDFLGSLLALGLRREVIGDIITADGNSAVVFVMRTVADFIVSSLERIGSDKVRVKILPALPESLAGGRKFKEVSDTVASARLDAVLGALMSLSREKASALINGGSVEVNYLEAAKTDARVGSGDIISVRGTGKFVVDDISETTKKGRLRLRARKYI